MQGCFWQCWCRYFSALPQIDSVVQGREGSSGKHLSSKGRRISLITQALRKLKTQWEQFPHSWDYPRKSVAFESKITAKESAAVMERAPASVSEMATASAAANNWQGDLGFSIAERTAYLAMSPFLLKYL